MTLQVKQRVVFVDVDDTLVRSVGTKRIPMTAVIARVRELHAAGVALYLWSSGGADYARSSAVELGIESCFIAFLPKPDAYLDDQAVHEWRYCLHVLPGNAEQLQHGTFGTRA
jgi:predicted HAD superfamily phosphohydrolase YqeG